MKKLYKKNKVTMYTIEAFADCSMNCACWCAVCHCWGPDFLHISDSSTSGGGQNFIPNATAQVS